MTTLAGHRGVAEDDPRNSGPVAFFRPKAVTRESVRRLLSRSLRRASPTDIEVRVDKIMTRITAGHVKPSPPLIARKVHEELAKMGRWTLNAETPRAAKRRCVFLQVLRMAREETKVISMLCVKLRLGTQSRTEKRVAEAEHSRMSLGARPWDDRTTAADRADVLRVTRV
jgi:hypothetical protein